MFKVLEASAVEPAVHTLCNDYVTGQPALWYLLCEHLNADYVCWSCA